MDETEVLREELEHYQAERERVRRILGQIGGANSKRQDKLINVIFLVLVTGLFMLDVLRELALVGVAWMPRFISLELALLLVSLKIVWMIHRQSKVDHFQFWMLNSIEFRLNDIGKRLKQTEERLGSE
jgi:hypothetical protein